MVPRVHSVTMHTCPVAGRCANVLRALWPPTIAPKLSLEQLQTPVFLLTVDLAEGKKSCLSASNQLRPGPGRGWDWGPVGIGTWTRYQASHKPGTLFFQAGPSELSSHNYTTSTFLLWNIQITQKNYKENQSHLITCWYKLFQTLKFTHM